MAFGTFDKPPYNNRDVPLYFLSKLWVEFFLVTMSTTLTLVNSRGWVMGS
jgi:hypothetical protein